MTAMRPGVLLTPTEATLLECAVCVALLTAPDGEIGFSRTLDTSALLRSLGWPLVRLYDVRSHLESRQNGVVARLAAMSRMPITGVRVTKRRIRVADTVAGLEWGSSPEPVTHSPQHPHDEADMQPPRRSRYDEISTEVISRRSRN